MTSNVSISLNKGD